MLQTYLDRLPLIAILRGVTPGEILAIGRALADAGFAIIEVPLNSPSAIDSIGLLAREFGDKVLVGAGTVTTLAQVSEIAEAGGRIIVMPHADVAVIRAAKFVVRPFVRLYTDHILNRQSQFNLAVWHVLLDSVERGTALEIEVRALQRELKELKETKGRS